MNFALIMFIALVVTGGIWLIDHFTFGRRRRPGDKEPWWVEYSKSFFPVILIVFVLRSFLVEPFKIPSGSMIPTLMVGDFILVNKYTYGIRLPIVNEKIIDINDPERGDVVVFRFPQDPTVDYIKRIVALPGDTVTYNNKHLIINGEVVATTKEGQFSYVESGLNYVTADLFKEKLGDHVHSIILQSDTPTYDRFQVADFPHRDQCTFQENLFTCTVPQGYYFAMGDNRDRSNDSRYWGFVPDKNIVGKAFLIWWNFDDFGRIGERIK